MARPTTECVACGAEASLLDSGVVLRERSVEGKIIRLITVVEAIVRCCGCGTVRVQRKKIITELEDLGETRRRSTRGRDTRGDEELPPRARVA